MHRAHGSREITMADTQVIGDVCIPGIQERRPATPVRASLPVI